MSEVIKLGKRLSNWGRWGAEDEKGATNLIGPDELIHAASLVRRGSVFDLGIPLDPNGPQTGLGGRMNPMLIVTETGEGQNFPGSGLHFCDDYIFMPLQAASQWDGLAHVYYDDHMYNGFPSSGMTAKGADHCSIAEQAKGVAGRGVLLDVAAHLKEDWLPVGYPITAAVLSEVAEAQGVSIGKGDILLVRTGWRKMFLDTKDREVFMSGEPGLGFDTLEWLAERDIAAVCSDNWGVEVHPSEDAGETLPFHMIAIRDMGLLLGELLDFEELSADCHADGVWEFLFVGPPIKFSRAVGSPINPLALK